MSADVFQTAEVGRKKKTGGMHKPFQPKEIFN